MTTMNGWITQIIWAKW